MAIKEADLPEKGDKMTELNLIKLLEISGMDSLTFRVEPPIRLRYFENWLKSNNCEKVLDEGETELYGNFRVVYRKGTYDIILVCDVDGYIIEINITKR